MGCNGKCGSWPGRSHAGRIRRLAWRFGRRVLQQALDVQHLGAHIGAVDSRAARERRGGIDAGETGVI